MAIVPALLRVRVPPTAEAAGIEALLARSIAAAVAASPELNEIPQLAREAESTTRVLTYALVLHADVLHPPPDPDELVRAASDAADRAMRVALGQPTGAAAIRARTTAQLAACRRAVVGAPYRHRHT